MSAPFRNNLAKGDRVLDVRTKRLADVMAQPREDSVNVMVSYQGHSALTRTYVGVEHLRLVVDGKPEEVPPIDGEIPEHPSSSKKGLPPAAFLSPVESLKIELSGNLLEIEEMNTRCKQIRARNDKIEAAIKVLS